MGATLGELGEAAVLARVFPRLPESSVTVVGPGDDAAVLTAPDGRFVVTTDTMVHGPDFRLAWSTPHDLGWKAAASNLADVAAMGARPTALVVALAAPTDTPVDLLEGLADGLRDACLALAPGCGVVGGDLATSATLTIAVTAFGDLEGRSPVLRSGARPGDVVAVSGDLVLAERGLALLFARGIDDSGRPDAARAAALRAEFPAEIQGQLAPRPPVVDGQEAGRAGATAMLDVSDGLALDARRLARASGVRLDFDAAALGSDRLGGAESHALLATFPPRTALPGGFRAVGTVRAGAGLAVGGADYEHPGGWDPFAGWDGAGG